MKNPLNAIFPPEPCSMNLGGLKKDSRLDAEVEASLRDIIKGLTTRVQTLENNLGEKTKEDKNPPKEQVEKEEVAKAEKTPVQEPKKTIREQFGFGKKNPKEEAKVPEEKASEEKAVNLTRSKPDGSSLVGGAKKSRNTAEQMAKRASTRRSTTRKDKKDRKASGTRKSKLSPALKSWNQRVMEKFREGRKRNPNYMLRDAMKDAKKSS